MTHTEHLSSLGDVPLGCEVTIRQLRYPTPGISNRMRELGIRENARIRPMLRANGNTICALNTMRIGIDEALAEAILVDYPARSVPA